MMLTWTKSHRRKGEDISVYGGPAAATDTKKCGLLQRFVDRGKKVMEKLGRFSLIVFFWGDRWCDG